MPTTLENPTGELSRLGALLEQATAELAPQDGPRRGGVLISNDVGYSEIGSEVHERLQQVTGGMGVFIGSGGLLSILPNLQIECAVLLDVDPAVIDFNKYLIDAVQSSSGPNEALEQVKGHPSHDQQAISEGIANEAQAYGPYHWSDPARFEQTQQALSDTPIAHINVDIHDRKLGDRLKETLGEYGLDISFLNLTNVHQWMGNLGLRMLLRRWPIRTDAVILYSTEGLDSRWPKIRLASDLEQYLEFTEREFELEQRLYY